MRGGGGRYYNSAYQQGYSVCSTMSAHSPLSTASRNARSLHRFVSLDSAWALLWILLTAFLGYVATTSFLSGGLVLPAQPINSMGVACGSESEALSQPYLFFAPTSTMTALQTVCVSSCPNTEADMLTCNATHVALSTTLHTNSRSAEHSGAQLHIVGASCIAVQSMLLRSATVPSCPALVPG
jgi:hypothetical protein